ncbi:MAG: hypothetical protein U0V75_10470 [Ferruginibacter sp.]
MEDIKAQEPVKLQPKKGSSFKRFVRWLSFILLAILGVFIYWKYYFTYSNGLQSGKMQKISRRGNVFKTWEGYLLISVSTDNNLSLITKEFPFSVTSDSIAHVLENYDGKKVRVRYKQKNGTLPWRGDSEYIVYQVEADQ